MSEIEIELERVEGEWRCESSPRKKRQSQTCNNNNRVILLYDSGPRHRFRTFILSNSAPFVAATLRITQLAIPVISSSRKN
jgi:hypothetical protein